MQCMDTNTCAGLHYADTEEWDTHFRSLLRHIDEAFDHCDDETSTTVELIIEQCGVSIILFDVFDYMSLFSSVRVSAEAEEEGLDVHEHNEQGYSL